VLSAQAKETGKLQSFPTGGGGRQGRGREKVVKRRDTIIYLLIVFTQLEALGLVCAES
jgi:hypothetical protein